MPLEAIFTFGPVRHMSVRAVARTAETTDRHGQRPYAPTFHGHLGAGSRSLSHQARWEALVRARFGLRQAPTPNRRVRRYTGGHQKVHTRSDSRCRSSPAAGLPPSATNDRLAAASRGSAPSGSRRLAPLLLHPLRRPMRGSRRRVRARGSATSTETDLSSQASSATSFRR
jgi:hypothetical protein